MIKRKYVSTQWQGDSDYRIPSELLQWLTRNSNSFLVKGGPGTGKTTLALTLLRAANFRQNFLYVSTKGSLSQMLRDHSWLYDYLGLSKQQTSNDRHKYFTRHGVFVDARLDEQSDLFEMISDELMNQRSPMIIIDSWDQISETMETEALLANAKVLQTWCERASGKLIFISSAQEKTFDSMVDGIAVLRQDYLEGRRIREILFTKILGIETVRPSYYFTLDKSIFRSFDPYRLSDFNQGYEKHVRHSIADSKEHLRPRYIPTLHRELDRVLGGGFSIGSIAIVEIGSNINSNIVIAIFRKMLDHLMKNGNLLLCQPLRGIDSEQISQFLGSFQQNPRKSRIEVLWPNLRQNEASAPHIPERRPDNALEDIASNLRKRFPERLLVALLELPSILDQHEWNDEWMNRFVRFMHGNIDLSILVARKGSISERTNVAAETRFELLDMRGTLFLTCNVPYSQFYAISIEKGIEGDLIELEPMI